MTLHRLTPAEAATLSVSANKEEATRRLAFIEAAVELSNFGEETGWSAEEAADTVVLALARVATDQADLDARIRRLTGLGAIQPGSEITRTGDAFGPDVSPADAAKEADRLYNTHVRRAAAPQRCTSCRQLTKERSGTCADCASAKPPKMSGRVGSIVTTTHAEGRVKDAEVDRLAALAVDMGYSRTGA